MDPCSLKNQKMAFSASEYAYARVVMVVREDLIPVSSGIAETYAPTEKEI